MNQQHRRAAPRSSTCRTASIRLPPTSFARTMQRAARRQEPATTSITLTSASPTSRAAARSTPPRWHHSAGGSTRRSRTRPVETRSGSDGATEPGSPFTRRRPTPRVRTRHDGRAHRVPRRRSRRPGIPRRGARERRPRHWTARAEDGIQRRVLRSLRARPRRQQHRGRLARRAELARQDGLERVRVEHVGGRRAAAPRRMHGELHVRRGRARMRVGRADDSHAGLDGEPHVLAREIEPAGRGR